MRHMRVFEFETPAYMCTNETETDIRDILDPRPGVHNSYLMAGQIFFLTYPRAKVDMF